MSTLYITKGCPTTGGGQVITGNSSFLVDGIPVACVGDKATCPLHKTTATIITGDPYMQVMGKSVARVNDSLSCGCKLLPRQTLVVGDTGHSSGIGNTGAIASNLLNSKLKAKPDHDTQIQFVNWQGDPFADIEYKLNLVDGSTRKGTTDSDGRTERIETVGAVEIKKATFYGKKSNHLIPKKKNDISLFTNQDALGTSVQVCELEISKRPLTQGEKDIAQQIFKNGIDYTEVFIHNEEYLWLGLQRNDTVMTPNGQIYYPDAIYKNDFSVSSVTDIHLFIHEMGHVWQFQLGYPVKRKGLLLHPSSLWGVLYDAYDYTLDSSKKLCDYNMEQQPDIIADYASLYILSLNVAKKHYLKADFELTLSDFIQDPSDAKNLPKK